MSGEKPKYRVMRLSHIYNNLWPEGSEIEYDGEPGSALEPINDAAKAAKTKVTGKAAEVVTNATTINDTAEDGDLDKIREEYEMLFNEKPHHNAKAETLREKIADKRKELGV